MGLERCQNQAALGGAQGQHETQQPQLHSGKFPLIVGKIFPHKSEQIPEQHLHPSILPLAPALACPGISAESSRQPFLRQKYLPGDNTWSWDQGTSGISGTRDLCSSQQKETASSVPSLLHGKKPEETPAMPPANVLHPCTGTGTSLMRGVVSCIRIPSPPSGEHLLQPRLCPGKLALCRRA